MIFSERGNEPNIYNRQERDESQEKEIIVETRGEAVEKIKETFRRLLEERFGSQGNEPLDFHSPEHSETVANDARAFLEIIELSDPDLVTEEDKEEAEIEGLTHDASQFSKKEKGKPRKRHRGWKYEDIPQDLRDEGVTIGNERESADEMAEELRKYRYPNGKRVFDDKKIEVMANDIAVTFPNFDFFRLPDGSKGLKVWQPYVTPDTRLVGLALSVGDLQGEARISKDPKVFRERGNAEFRELNWEIGEALAGGIENISQEDRIDIAKKIIVWTELQKSFIHEQGKLFWEKVNMNNTLNRSAKHDEIVEALGREFSHFDINENIAQERYERVKAGYEGKLGALNHEDFLEVLREVDYAV